MFSFQFYSRRVTFSLDPINRERRWSADCKSGAQSKCAGAELTRSLQSPSNTGCPPVFRQPFRLRRVVSSQCPKKATASKPGGCGRVARNWKLRLNLAPVRVQMAARGLGKSLSGHGRSNVSHFCSTSGVTSSRREGGRIPNDPRNLDARQFLRCLPHGLAA